MNNEKIQINFDHMQLWLLMHKYWYYIENDGQIEDQQYDSAEEHSRQLAKSLGFRANKLLGPEENEKHHIHWMVDFDENSVYWEDCKLRFKRLLPKSLYK